MSPTPNKSPETLPAGPELDRMVAEACGFCEWAMAMPQSFVDDGGQEVFRYRTSCSGEQWGPKILHKVCECGKLIPSQSFRPSTDWNDAMLAAENAGLFSQDQHDLVLQGLGHGFCLCPCGGVEVVASSETGPLAICRAILKVKP